MCTRLAGGPSSQGRLSAAPRTADENSEVYIAQSGLFERRGDEVPQFLKCRQSLLLSGKVVWPVKKIRFELSSLPFSTLQKQKTQGKAVPAYQLRGKTKFRVAS
jgi:hypothetical protein